MDKCYRNAKITALIIPAIISATVFVIVIIKAFRVSTNMQAVDFKLDAGLSVIGIAITVWVGLNIYNLIEKKEVDRISKLYEELQSQIDEQEKRDSYLQSFNDWNTVFINLNVDINITPIYEKGDRDYIIESINTLINKFEIMQQKNLQLRNPDTAIKGRQFSILLGAFSTLLAFKQFGNQPQEKDYMIRFITQTLNAMIDSLPAEYKEKPREDFSRLYISYGRSDSDPKKRLKLIEENIKELGLENPIILGKIYEIDERLDKIIHTVTS